MGAEHRGGATTVHRTLLQHYTTAILHYRTAALQHYTTSALLHYTTTALLHYNTALHLILHSVNILSFYIQGPNKAKDPQNTIYNMQKMKKK